jgi:hypothetical protein
MSISYEEVDILMVFQLGGLKYTNAGNVVKKK